MLCNHKKIIRFLSVILMAALLSGLLALPGVAADIPTGVDGRILPASKAGDNSEWLEIARYNGYSLILRRNVLNNGQVAFDSRNIDAYQISDVRNMVNTWFKNTLGANARLRDFTVKSDPLKDIGYFGVVTNGFCMPTATAARTGDDVAFLLSFAEAAMFCSEQYAITTTSWTSSPAVAKKNFAKIPDTPTYNNYKAFWWLRSGGHNASSTKSASSVGSHSLTLINCVYASSSQANYPYLRPALWVGSGIFDDGKTVKGKVWPMLSEDLWGIGPSFVNSHAVVVELRSTFQTPASAALSTKTVLLDSTGLGEFTFTNVPNGNYILYIKRPGYLTRSMKVSITDSSPQVVNLAPPGTADGGVFNLWWGDCTDDWRVDNDDILMILELMGMNVNAFNAYYNPACDMNGDGLIDNEDIQMVLEMWNRTIRMYPGAGDVNFYE